jgi:aminopeptidase N
MRGLAELKKETNMSRLIRGIGVFLIVAAGVASQFALGQSAAPGAGPRRPPFVKAGTPRNRERIRFFDVKHIKAKLVVDTVNHQLSGVVTHTISPLHPLLSTVELDCGPDLKITKVSAGTTAAPCTFGVKEGTLAIRLDRSYGPGEDLDVAVEYSGKPARGLYFVEPADGHPRKMLSFWTQGESEDTRCWLPCYDYPNERATSEMIITVPKPLFVLSNGVLLEKQDSGATTTYHWKMDVPHVSYLISLAGAEFAVYHDRLGDLPLDYYVAKHVDEATARRFMGHTPKMIRFFGDRTGQPYPYNKYAQVCVPDFVAGGMENITATTMTDSELVDEIAALEGDSDSLVAHELAHQWFGDYLTCKDWSHIWLNEGFATYFAAIFTEDDRGDDAFRLEMHKTAGGYQGGDRFSRRALVEERYRSSEDMFDGVTYSKGACVLHVLRGLMGDAAWWKGIREYVASHKLQIVETDDFRKSMEAASGQDLKWFFDQWVYKAGHPELKVRWHYEDADKTVRVNVQQTQALDEQTPLFRLPTTLQITESTGGPRVIPILIDGRSHEFVIACQGRPKMVEIDPRGWLLKDIHFEKADDENLFQLEHAACVLGRLSAAEALVKKARANVKAVKALADAWKREKAPSTRHELFAILCNGAEVFRAALIEGASDHEPRVRVAAIGGLGRLRRTEKSEAVLRAAWNDPKQPYGSRKAALRGLVRWKVKDAPELLDKALKITAGDHTIAVDALDLSLATPGAKARELAALYTKKGQPPSLRSTAVGAFSRLAKNDPALEKTLIELCNDSDRMVRFMSWMAVRQLKLKKALPVLEARVGRDHLGFGGIPGDFLADTIKELKEEGSKRARSNPAPTRAKAIAELETELGELNRKSDELANQIAELRRKRAEADRGSSDAAGAAAAPGGSP